MRHLTIAKATVVGAAVGALLALVVNNADKLSPTRLKRALKH